MNHAKYRALRNLEQKREADRQRIAEKRKKNRDVAIGSPGVAVVAHADADAPTDAKSKTLVALRRDAVEILGFLNEKAGRNYEPVMVNIEMIVARLKEGATPDDCRAVIAKKCREWKTDERMSLYLRPATLFNRTKFAQYKGELVAA